MNPVGDLQADIWHRLPEGYVGEGKVAAKWNVVGSCFTVIFEQAQGFGTAGVWLDGRYQGAVNLDGQGQTCFQTQTVDMGLHAVKVAPLAGRIAIRELQVSGERE